MNDLTFSQLGLPAPLLAAVAEIGFEAPSSIQSAAIPVALEGHDLIGLSETGSGKTAAFGLAGLAGIDLEKPSPQMLVVCPTRELAVQVCGELQQLGSKLPGLRALAVYGGAPIDRQIRALRQGTHVIVGTPGRLIDHVKRGTLDLSGLQFVVLDEADRMLDMGFVEEVESILKAAPEERQTLFFSATMNKGVKRLIDRFGKEPRTVEIERESLTVASIDQVCFEARQRSRIELISRIVDLEQPRLALIFCNTKRAVDECTESLLSRGYSADRLHGDINQHLRERVLRLFKEGTVEILVATDVAARGIDVDDIDIVFNYDLPQDPEDYVHRVGRTGRAGRSGKAISFIHGRDIYRIKTIERYIRQPIPRGTVPSAEEVDSQLADRLIETVGERLGDESYEKDIADLQALRDQGHEWDDIAGVLMKLVREMTSREAEEIHEDRADYQPGRPEAGAGKRDRGDRGDRRDKKPHFARDSGTEQGMTSLFLSLGKRNRINPGDIVGMLHNECHLEPGSVGRIQLFPNFSLVEVRESSANQAIEESKGAKLRGQTFTLAPDRGRPDGGGKGRKD
ncbi:MAG: DEAD/DEAH box helicase [Verrucomicrobiales bacterium]